MKGLHFTSPYLSLTRATLLPFLQINIMWGLGRDWGSSLLSPLFWTPNSHIRRRVALPLVSSSKLSTQEILGWTKAQLQSATFAVKFWQIQNLLEAQSRQMWKPEHRGYLWQHQLLWVFLEPNWHVVFTADQEKELRMSNSHIFRALEASRILVASAISWSSETWSLASRAIG